MSRHMKSGPRGKGRGGENSSRTSRVSRSTNEEVQRVIEGLKDMPDDELQEFLDDEEFMQGLNVVDAWDGDEELGDEYMPNRDAKERDYRRLSRDRNRRNHRGTFHNSRDQRDRQKREERRRDDARRDPSKSSKDIERDKMRTKRDTDNKILAEKEKAIKHLLDSDKVVPPGTESEAIETEKQNVDDMDDHILRSRDRRRSLERHKISPVRRRSGERIRLSSSHRTRSPQIITPERRRSTDRHRKTSWERKESIERRERKSSAERHRRRQEQRDLRWMNRRSRSRERHRSRSQDRFRKRWSRSPVGRRGSPRRRSMSKSPSRRRKRSPFINEIARQFRDEALMSTTVTNQGFMQQSTQRIQPPPALLSTPMHGQVQMPPQHYMPHQDTLGLSAISGPSGPPNLQFNPFETHPPQGTTMNFEPMPMHPMPQPDYSAPPISYNAPTNPVQMHPQGRPGFTQVNIRSPQPVPAPTPMEQSMMFNHPSQQQQCHTQIQNSPSPQPDRVHSDGGHHHTFSDQRSGGGIVSAAYNGVHKTRRDRLKTPEPPVISESKVKTASYPFEKTSLSSLLEASVSAKDTGHPVLYPGFKPEILRHCELALCDLPDEDPRLKIKGRFFFDPTKKELTNDAPITASNSILLQKNRGKSLWEEVNAKKDAEPLKPMIETHPKYCQTELEVDTKSTQTEIEVADFCVQVCPGELQPSPREEKRPIMDRLDWNVRETYDYTPKIREVDDLRWSLSNSSQKRSWNRGISPSSQEREERIRSPGPGLRPIQDEDSRDYRRGSPIRNREHFTVHRSSNRDFSPRPPYSPDFRRDLDHEDDYHDVRSDHSRGDSPMIIDDHDEDIEVMEPEPFHRESSWRGRGKSYGQSTTSHKSRSNRGKHSGGRSYRGRGSGYRGKF